MRRRFVAIVFLLAVVVSGTLAVRAFAVACQRPVSLFAVLAEFRDGRRPSMEGPTDAEEARQRFMRGPGAGFVNAILAIKQADYIAFPAHVAAAWTLETAGCEPAAIRDQWLKAARHAWADGPAAWAAAGLARTVGPGIDLPQLLRADSELMPWFDANLGRVTRAMRVDP